MIWDRTEDPSLVPAKGRPERPNLPDLRVKPPPDPLTPNTSAELSPHPHSAPQPTTPALRVGNPLGPMPSGSISGVSPQNRRVKHMKHRSADADAVDIQPLQPTQLAAMLADEPFIIIVDVRPFATYACMRVHDAISICIPSTLLKRPTFGFNRIMDFVAPQDAERLQRLTEASCIVFYDHSTSSLGALQNTPLARTASKILGAEPTALAGKLYFVAGGITAVAQQVPELIQTDDSLRTQDEEVDAPKLSLGNVSAAPRSPFTLLPVVTAVRTSLASPVSTLSPKMPPLDDSTRLGAPPEVSANMDALPRWLAEAILRTGSGQNVLAEAFQRLQAAESQRVSQGGRDRLSARLLSPRKHSSALKSPHSSPIYMSPNSTVSSSHSTSNSTNTSPVAGTADAKQPQYLLVTGEDPSKNRYTNIAPFSHNRVVARGQYLNASFIHSHLSPLRYIATQAPVPASFADFWWCVWEQRVPLIVMLTVLTTESGQIKSHRYWDSGIYDGLYVECISETMQSESNETGIVLRRFVLRNDKDEERYVSQLQYERWPDLGCPANPDEVLRLVDVKRSIMAESQTISDPVIVHCSAGCGRTGTFCTIDTVTDYMWRVGPEAAREDTTDRIFTTVSEFREQRIAMVQNQKQLLLCYESVMLWALKNYAQQRYFNENAHLEQKPHQSTAV